MKKALITGIGGMDGSFMAELLLSKGYEVFGLDRPKSIANIVNIKHLLDKITLVSGDLTDAHSLLKVIDEVRPTEVYNFAAQSFIGISWKLAEYTAQVNAIGVINLLEAITNIDKTIKFQQASTSEMFGTVGGVANEQTPFNPVSPYAASKAFAHAITTNFRDSYDLFTCCSMCFNHESERRGIQFVTRKITDGVAKIGAGLADSISLGNLESERDWGYAPDYVEGIWKMLQQPSPDDYVFATGKSHSIRDFLSAAFKAIGVKNWEKYVKKDPRFMRPVDVSYHIGDYSKAKSVLSWEPKVGFEDLVEIMVKNDIKLICGGSN